VRGLFRGRARESASGIRVWRFLTAHGTVEGQPLEEVDTVPDPDQEAPLAQSCPDCRALVADLDAHSRWHSRLVADIATAVEEEIRRVAAG
jgi:hypothetical protein